MVDDDMTPNDPNRCNDCPAKLNIVPIFRSLAIPIQIHMFTNFVVNLVCFGVASVTGREFVDRHDLKNLDSVRLDYEDMFHGLPTEKVLEKELLSCFIVYVFFKRFAINNLYQELWMFADSESLWAWNDRDMFVEVFKGLNLDIKELRKVSKDADMKPLRKSKDDKLWVKLLDMIHEEFFEDLSEDARQFRKNLATIICDDMDRIKSKCEEYELLHRWHSDMVTSYEKIWRKNQPHKDFMKMGIVCQESSIHNSASEDKHIKFFWDNIKNIDNLGNVQMGISAPSPRAYFTFCCYGAKMKQHNYSFKDPRQKLRAYFATLHYHKKHNIFLQSFAGWDGLVTFQRYPIKPHVNHDKCKVCSKKGLVCKACKTVRYCGVDCQKSDWTTTHKSNCKIYQLFLQD